MIVGVGLDLIETARIQGSLDRFGSRFIERVFVEDEISYCQSMKNPARHFAARFAAKEAASKAFGTGIGESLGWKDIEVCRLENGKPGMRFHGRGAELAGLLAVSEIHVSLTHHETTAAAVVILCRTENR